MTNIFDVIVIFLAVLAHGAAFALKHIADVFVLIRWLRFGMMKLFVFGAAAELKDIQHGMSQLSVLLPSIVVTSALRKHQGTSVV
jgi:hypothetical protein